MLHCIEEENGVNNP